MRAASCAAETKRRCNVDASVSLFGELRTSKLQKVDLQISPEKNNHQRNLN